MTSVRTLLVFLCLASSTAALVLGPTASVRGGVSRTIRRVGGGRSRPRAPAPRCGAAPPRDEQKAAERAETVEYLKTLGGFTAGSFGLFTALTAGAGLEDVAAGNLVLVALCAYGAYLLFFDGGVTQAALENQAIMQLAQEEGDIMATAPRADVGVFAAEAVAVEPTPAVAKLERDGFARVDSVLAPETASELLTFVNAELEKKAAEAASDDDLSATSSFGDVLMRDNRYDLLLDLDAPVRKALDEVLAPLRPVLEGSVGPEAELFELAALVSDPRAPRQPVHPDTPFREADPGASIITAFVALQDVDESMGPTDIIPNTHTAEAHARFNNNDDGGRERVALLRELPNHRGTLNTGAANLIDSRLIHAGGGNDSNKRRVLFYVSFRRKGKVTPSGSLLYKLRRAGCALDNVGEWAAAAGAADALA